MGKMNWPVDLLGVYYFDTFDYYELPSNIIGFPEISRGLLGPFNGCQLEQIKTKVLRLALLQS
jgi:hypothetical protein